MRTRLAIATSLAGLLASGSAMAGACTQQSLANYLSPGFDCTVGDALFGAFQYSPTAAGGATAVAATDVTVTPLNEANNPGLLFSSGAWYSLTGQANDAVIMFAAIAPQEHPFTDARLTIAGQAVGTNDSFVGVGETITAGDPASFTLSAWLPDHASDHVLFDTGYTNLDIAKDALVLGGVTTNALALAFGGIATLTAISQNFSQGESSPPPPPSGVPEPATLALLGIGLLGLGITRLRTKPIV